VQNEKNAMEKMATGDSPEAKRAQSPKWTSTPQMGRVDRLVRLASRTPCAPHSPPWPPLLVARLARLPQHLPGCRHHPRGDATSLGAALKISANRPIGTALGAAMAALFAS